MVRKLPICKNPVGDGANLTLILLFLGIYLFYQILKNKKSAQFRGNKKPPLVGLERLIEVGLGRPCAMGYLGLPIEASPKARCGIHRHRIFAASQSTDGP